MGGKTPKTTTTTQTSSPWAGIQPGLTQAANDTTALYQNGGLNLQYYPDSTVAPLSDVTNQALNLTGLRALNGSPVTKSAQNTVTNMLQSGFVDPSNNPYFKGVLNDVADAYGRGTHATTDAFFNKAGGWGSSAYNETTQANNKAFADSLNTLANNQYQQNIDTQGKAAALAPSLAQSDYTDLSALQGVGNVYDTQNQNQLNDQINRFNFNQQAPAANIQSYIDLLNGAGGNYKTATGITPNGGNSTAQSIGGGLSALGSAANAGLSSYALYLALSDIRAKENIKHLGYENNWPIYEYNYKGDDTIYQGVMAQDVQKIKPEAIQFREDGLMMVNYGMIGIRMRKVN